MEVSRFFEGGSLPSFCGFGGTFVHLKTDFRLWLRYEQLLEAEISGEEKTLRCIESLITSFTTGAKGADIARALSWFHTCGDSERLRNLDVPPNITRVLAEAPRTSSVYWDFWPLWASFKKQHGMDLYLCGDLHWWEFKRLCGELKPDTPFASLRHFRSLTVEDFKSRDGKMTSRSRKDWNLTKAEQVYRALPGAAENGNP